MPKIDDQPEDPFEDLVLDEDFVRAAEHKEPSGRSRMLAARWKRTPPQNTEWRPPVVPLKKQRRERRAARLRGVGGRWQLPLFVVLAVALVLASLNAGKIHDWAFGKAPGTSGATGLAGAGVSAAAQETQPALTASPTAAPPTDAADQTPTPAHPFVGSPADQWPSGTAGIALPAAKPVGVFSARTVGRDEQLVQQYLQAAYLDPKTVAGGYPDAALALLDPANRAWAKKKLDHPTAQDDAQELFSRFDPKQAVPLSDVRVQGVVSLSPDKDHGLLIRADFLFVYASHPVGSTDDVERTIARRILTFRFYDPAHYQTHPGTLWIEDEQGYTGNQLCGFTGGLLVPYFQLAQPSGTASAPAPSGTPIDPYDMSKQPAQMADCNQDTRN